MKLVSSFFGGPGGGGAYIKSMGTKVSANAGLITVETYVQQDQTMYGPTCENIEGPGGPSMIRLGLSCFPAILPPISMYMSNKEAI